MMCDELSPPSQHVLLISELSRKVMAYKLMDVSEVEQQVVSEQSIDHQDVLKKISVLVKDSNIRDIDALRLVALYSLRFEGSRHNQTQTLVSYLKHKRKLSDRFLRFLSCLSQYGGVRFRQTDIFNKKFSIRKIYRSTVFGKGQARSIYCQHTPPLVDLIDRALKGRLNDSRYPMINKENETISDDQKFTNILVFTVGGLTYEEICAVHTKFAQDRHVQVLLGSTGVHNFVQFIDEVLCASEIPSVDVSAKSISQMVI